MFKINKYLAEETGIHVGDGSMNIYNNNQHLYTVACHKMEEKNYMDHYVLPLIKRIYKKEPKPRYWSQGSYGFRICSKDIITFKKEKLGLPLGKKINIEIPRIIKRNTNLMRHFLRGLFDTDGSLTLTAQNNTIYPRIYFSNISKKLVKQVQEFLSNEGYKVQTWKITYDHKPWNDTYKLSVNSEIMLNKWVKEIGFSNTKHLIKLQKFNTLQKAF
ncbi:MAG: LAGLIDADG family homing endonuclease [Candidatus Woesearchaeota archaeon]|jgi:hypothetical protein|nr:LAGLIDADG family homing endonuclease [Candidatus Woesearchaeota archaeon]MDP7458025.1 LAGLIDADG family homing endonuclease [Candidatus Woesearchaeota archaeon]|tara:strand:+ start:440 stop:1087 length:648 start_codon:yes stop_codon:yes gene_type:complete